MKIQMQMPRSARVLAFALPTMLLVAACSPGSPEGGEGGDDPSTIRVVAGNEPNTINPIYSSVTDAKSWGGMYDALLGNDPTSNAPNDDGLLYGWEEVDPTTWRFQVREGVTFHNGESFDANAAAFTILTARDDPRANLGLFYQEIVDAQAVGDDLEVTTTTPLPSLPDILASTMAIAPGAWEELGDGEDFANAPVGTGPYQFVSYSRGGTLSLEAYDDYWQGQPGADALEVSWSADAQARASFVETGQADLALDLTPQALPVLSDSDDVVVRRAQTDARYFIYFNMHQGALADQDLRRAFAMAIDKDAIVDSVFREGGATRYDHFVGDLYEEAPQHDDAITYDPDEARRLVEEAGSPTVTLTYAAGRAPNDAQIGTAIVGMLEAVGFTVTNEQVDFPTFVERRNSGALEAAGGQIIYTFRDPDEQFRAWVNSTSVSQNCESAWYDEASAEALAESDPESRQAMYEEMENRLLHEDVCYLPIVQYEGIWAMSSDLAGFEEPRLGTPNYFALPLTDPNPEERSLGASTGAPYLPAHSGSEGTE